MNAWAQNVPNATHLAADGLGQHIATATLDGHVHVFQASTGESVCAHHTETPCRAPYAGSSHIVDGVCGLAVTPTASVFVAQASMASHSGDRNVHFSHITPEGERHDIYPDLDASMVGWDRPWTLASDHKTLVYSWLRWHKDFIDEHVELRVVPQTLNLDEQHIIDTGEPLDLEPSAIAYGAPATVSEDLRNPDYARLLREAQDGDESALSILAREAERRSDPHGMRISGSPEIWAAAGDMLILGRGETVLQRWDFPKGTAYPAKVVIGEGSQALFTASELNCTCGVFLRDGTIQHASLPQAWSHAKHCGFDEECLCARWWVDQRLVEQRLTDGAIRESSPLHDLSPSACCAHGFTNPAPGAPRFGQGGLRALRAWA